MKAGSLPDDDADHFARVPSVAILRRSVPRSVFAVRFSLPSSVFSITNFSFARVAEQQRHPTVNRASTW